MGFWDYVRAIADRMAPPAPPEVTLVANAIHLNPTPGVFTERAVARLARLEAALASGDKRQGIVDEIAQIKKSGI